MTVAEVMLIAGNPNVRTSGKWLYRGKGVVEFSTSERVVFIRSGEQLADFKPAVSVSGLGDGRASDFSGAADYSGVNQRTEIVHGYRRADGTYVPEYRRTVANDTKNDNYSTSGNINPVTGEKGYDRRDDGSLAIRHRETPSDPFPSTLQSSRYALQAIIERNDQIIDRFFNQSALGPGPFVTRSDYERASKERDDAMQKLVRLPTK
jgi:hypothetical protein